MTLSKFAFSAAAAVGFIAASAVGASAAVVCSGPVCWHTTERYEYPADSRVVVHEDTWKPTADAHVTFREHPGRGYWREDKWVEW